MKTYSFIHKIENIADPKLNFKINPSSWNPTIKNVTFNIFNDRYDWSEYRIKYMYRQYINTPIKNLLKLEPKTTNLNSQYMFTYIQALDLLKASDRRLGYNNLMYWSFTLDHSSWAKKVLSLRFGS